MNVFVGFFAPLTIALGLWQLDRGALKREMEMSYLDKLTTLPVAPTQASLRTDFQRVRVTGRFEDEYFLVDNQILSGDTGYWVVQVFEAEGDRYLVNRGFVAGPASRDQLPSVAWPDEEIRITGVVWPFTGLIPVFDDDVWTAGWPKRVQRLDIARMAATIDALPVELRLEGGQPGVLHAAPFAQVLSDAKHRGYAATWFGLFLALMILYFYFAWREKIGND